MHPESKIAIWWMKPKRTHSTGKALKQNRAGTTKTLNPVTAGLDLYIDL